MKYYLFIILAMNTLLELNPLEIHVTMNASIGTYKMKSGEKQRQKSGKIGLYKGSG